MGSVPVPVSVPVDVVQPPPTVVSPAVEALAKSEPSMGRSESYLKMVQDNSNWVSTLWAERNTTDRRQPSILRPPRAANTRRNTETDTAREAPTFCPSFPTKPIWKKNGGQRKSGETDRRPVACWSAWVYTQAHDISARRGKLPHRKAS